MKESMLLKIFFSRKGTSMILKVSYFLLPPFYGEVSSGPQVFSKGLLDRFSSHYWKYCLAFYCKFVLDCGGAESGAKQCWRMKCLWRKQVPNMRWLVTFARDRLVPNCLEKANVPVLTAKKKSPRLLLLSQHYRHSLRCPHTFGQPSINTYFHHCLNSATV